MEYNSIKNQEIKRKFVEKEVYANISLMVDYILQKSLGDEEAPFGYEEVENLYVYNIEVVNIEELKKSMNDYKKFPETYWEEFTEEQKELYLTELKEILELAYESKIENEEWISELEDLIYEVENAENEIKEVFEWYICSDFLIRRLKEKGEVVIPSMSIWGRCTTGQAILLDGVISEICEELEILENEKIY